MITLMHDLSWRRNIFVDAQIYCAHGADMNGVIPMSLSEVRLLLSNERDMRERRYGEDTESAFMYEAAANADGVGHERRGFALDTALKFAARAARNKRLGEAMARALDLLPAEK